MSINFYKVRLLIIIFFFLHSASTFSAIVFGTLVSTPNGLVPVQNLHIGDTVIGYCKKCRTLVESPITKIKKQKGKRLVLINVNNQNMLVSKNQIFFDPAKSKWIRARNITRNNYLLSYELIDNNIVFSKARCHSIQQVKRRSTVYEISLKYPHTFFISKAQILTHNFACSLGLGLAFGSGVISFETIAVSASFLGLGLYSLFGKKSKMKAHITYNPCNYNHTPNKKPDDDNDDDKKERKINTMTKTEAYEYLKNELGYENYKDGFLKRKPGRKGLGKNADLIRWDHLHNDLEAFRDRKTHTGSIDPSTWEFYKPPVFPRNAFDK